MNKVRIRTGLVLLVAVSSLSACSVTNKIGKSARSMTSFGQQSSTDSIAVDEKLTIPPSLRQPEQQASSSVATKPKKISSSSYTKPLAKNYYIVVGTYPDQEQALDVFVRLSSIGLSSATMESRTTKSGKRLHMVRLGPYNNQSKIDKAKDSLTSDGLTQFKVVEN